MFSSPPVPPSIEGQRHEGEVVEAVLGQPVELECSATGKPPPALAWLKDGLLQVESNGTRLLGGGAVLRIESASEDSGGIYTCLASSPAGESVIHYSVAVQGELGR